MKEEKVFDNRVAALVNEASLSGGWPKEELWRAVEKRQGEKKKAWYYYAAIVLLFLGFSGYLMSLSDSPSGQIAEGVKGESPQTPETIKEESLEKGMAKAVKVLPNRTQLATIIPQDESFELTRSKLEVAEVITQKERKVWAVEPMEPLSTSGLALSESAFEIALVKEAQLEEAKSIYLYIPEKGEKERYSKVGKLLNQIGRFNTEGEFDWEEVDVKPQLIWAYLKESAKSEKEE
ncbi:MAG: hypothetical protein ACI9IP_002180 [Arcticibacterium sp.]|jgi:hypothetical protein